MCLNVRKVKHSYKTESINGEKLIPVWKVLKSHYFNPCMLYSPHFYATWQKGWNVSDRPSIQTFRGNEEIGEEVFVGFHFFLTKKGAKIYCQELNRYANKQFSIYKMYVHKRDIVERGTTDIDWYKTPWHKIPSLVATQAYWKGNQSCVM